MGRMPSAALLVAALSFPTLPAVTAQEAPTGQAPTVAPALEAPKRVPKDAKVFILPAEGFEVYVAATTLLTGQTGSREEASVTVTHVATGTVTFAYAFSRGNTFRGKQSAAESIANHLKDHINGK